MASPLWRRLPRQIRANLGKNVGIFFLLVVTIAFGYGFLDGIATLQQMIAQIPEKYALEDGQFTSNFAIDNVILEKVEEAGNATIYENFSFDVPIEADGVEKGTVRVYSARESVDLACYFEGAAPASSTEIALNRNYCENNDIKLGDDVDVAGRTFKVCGILTLPDYTAMFESNNDLMLNSVTFCVAEVTKEGFESFTGEKETFTYSFIFDEKNQTAAQKADLEEDMIEELGREGVMLSDFIDADVNKGIQYASEDQEGDASIMTALILVVIVVVAFMFAVLISGTIFDESSIIGTLLANGVRKREIFMHYLAAPALIGIAGTIFGLLLGCTMMVDVVIGIYNENYSFPEAEHVFSWSAFIFTAVVPFVLLLAITSIAILRKMRLTPLQFLRRELSGARAHRSMRLSQKLSFEMRFRLRAILNNLSNYFVLAVGLLFAGILFMFGSGLLPSVDSYAKLMVENLPASHQYMLKAPVEVDGEAEKFAVQALEIKRPADQKMESISIYGVQDGSPYFSEVVDDADKVTIGRGMAEKFGLALGDAFALEDKYEGKTYDFEVLSLKGNTTDMNVYMGINSFNDMFENDESYFNAYVSDEPLNIEKTWLASEIDDASMGGYVDQLVESFQSVLTFFNVFALIVYFILMYLLTRVIIERNTRYISYLKVFGYTNREVGRLYIRSITIATVFFLLVTIPLASVITQAYCNWFFASYTGHIVMSFPWWTYIVAFAAGAVCYAIVSLFHRRAIRRVPLALALKIQE